MGIIDGQNELLVRPFKEMVLSPRLVLCACSQRGPPATFLVVSFHGSVRGCSLAARAGSAMYRLFGANDPPSRIPSLTRASGLGRCCSCFSRLLARICLASSRCWPCKAGAAFESRRIFPGPVSTRAQGYPHGPARPLTFDQFFLLWSV